MKHKEYEGSACGIVDSYHAFSFCCAPVLVMGFNRPDLARQQFKNLAQYKPTRVFFAVDGGRNEQEWALCRETQSAVSEIDWPCEVKTFFREENRGCRNAPPEAITWFFENVDSGIILEDDCHPSAGFLRFATELLEYYKNDERIGAITAFNRYNFQADKYCSYHFSKEFNVWGWASWRRVWKNYDVSMKRYSGDFDKLIERHTKNMRMRKYWHNAFRITMDGSLNTWDYQVCCMFMAHRYLSVIPRERLVANMGIGLPTAVHTGGYDFFAREFATMGRVDFPLVHPAKVEADEYADDRTERIMMGCVCWFLYNAGNVLPRPLRPLLTFFGRVLRFVAPWSFEL